jgi:hypothetical protein
MKYIKSTLTVIACFTVISMIAKQVGKKTEPTAPSTIISPQPSPVISNRPRPEPPYSAEATKGKQPQQKAPQKEYSQILNQLKRLQPSTADLNILDEILDEVNEQIKKGYAAKNPTKQPKELSMEYNTYAQELFKKHPINFYKTKMQCVAANDIDEGPFTRKELDNIEKSIANIVEDFLIKFPNISEKAIFEAIYFSNQSFQDLRNNLVDDQLAAITEYIENAVNLNYSMRTRRIL